MIPIISPGLLFGLILSALYAGLFHVWGGRNLRDLGVFLLASAFGFALGQLIGALLDLPSFRIGQVYMIEASLFAWLSMIGARELGLGKTGRKVDRA